MPHCINKYYVKFYVIYYMYAIKMLVVEHILCFIDAKLKPHKSNTFYVKPDINFTKIYIAV